MYIPTTVHSPSLSYISLLRQVHYYQATLFNIYLLYKTRRKEEAHVCLNPNSVESKDISYYFYKAVQQPGIFEGEPGCI